MFVVVVFCLWSQDLIKNNCRLLFSPHQHLQEISYFFIMFIRFSIDMSAMLGKYIVHWVYPIFFFFFLFLAVCASIGQPCFVTARRFWNPNPGPFCEAFVSHLFSFLSTYSPSCSFLPVMQVSWWLPLAVNVTVNDCLALYMFSHWRTENLCKTCVFKQH